MEENKKGNIDIFRDLKRRVKITTKSRINASARLRQKHEFFEKITHLYSLLVLILSVWFINIPNTVDSMFVTKILLILSLSLTFFTMFLGIKNYKERAGSFETNYQQLDALSNEINRLEVYPEKIIEDDEVLKNLQNRYEKLIIGNENHHDIDYWNANDDLKAKFKFDIKMFKTKQNFVNIIVAIYPFILSLFILIINYILKRL
ncbi:SLATT domain-containing protein [Peribacillus butanolivorans]|uniref:SLATT domain-containing protein n=1 Tax=Peribacillus butanolivorans TaxID=421767 RepID=UPI003650DA52